MAKLTAALFLSLCAHSAYAFLAPSSLPLRATARAAAVSRGRMLPVMQEAAVKDRAQDVGEGQASERKAAESLMQQCPETIWGPTVDIEAEQQKLKDAELPEFPTYVHKPADVTDEAAYFAENKDMLLQKLQDHGAVVLKGFSTTGEPEGFESMWKTLGMEACLDPLHSVAGRPVVSGKNAVYEAVNKPSRAKFFVGMHNEMVGKRTVRKAAFVCFKQAEKGGEFLLTDGRRMLRDVETAVLKRWYDSKIRFSSAELPMSFMDSLGPLQSVAEPAVKALTQVAVDMKVDFDVEMFWNRVDGQRVIQAHAPPQPPVILHPDTGLATWFCNVHSHSLVLRDERDGVLPETTGASRLNKSDCLFGDGSAIPLDDLKHIDEVTRKNIVPVLMEKGDVCLIDNYRAMHGRDVFEGTRKHAVTWFK
eukprot:CAMPEP_0114126388 /NCGR_PEP_ID=MMETSP0043_2-20121206/9806_1 /TAXON_ID=464988 /ORGANISM="Hemiselmis andersenii, Strain CCMP644" /LENGTH=419 /DNA_ID=CAMNT_0001219375 /DNA_START=62 /DNA_END=1321 /DNA_ORIENTATION=+